MVVWESIILRLQEVKVDKTNLFDDWFRFEMGEPNCGEPPCSRPCPSSCFFTDEIMMEVRGRRPAAPTGVLANGPRFIDLARMAFAAFSGGMSSKVNGE
jgi:hypothetical protein